MWSIQHIVVVPSEFPPKQKEKGEKSLGFFFLVGDGGTKITPSPFLNVENLFVWALSDLVENSAPFLF